MEMGLSKYFNSIQQSYNVGQCNAQMYQCKMDNANSNAVCTVPGDGKNNCNYLSTNLMLSKEAVLLRCLDEDDILVIDLLTTKRLHSSPRHPEHDNRNTI